jgi:hypothetical protein
MISTPDVTERGSSAAAPERHLAVVLLAQPMSAKPEPFDCSGLCLRSPRFSRTARDRVVRLDDWLKR